MSHVTVRYFASIRERLGRGEEQVTLAGPTTAAALWAQAVGQPWPGNTLVAVNQEYVSPDRLLRDGDEVAFFPPVTGG